MHQVWTIVGCALLLSACTSAASGPVAVFDPGSEGFFDTPWPSDARLTDAGVLDWAGFPNPTDIALIEQFIAAGDKHPGAPHNAPIYLRFDAPVDTWRLPDPADSASRAAAVQIVDVDPRSPQFGQRIPYEWELREVEGAYVPSNLLAVAPLPGWPLRPRTTYAVFATRVLGQPNATFTEQWTGEGPWATALAPLRAALPALGFERQDLAIATVFTTGDPTEELDGIARFLGERVEPPSFTPALEHLDDRAAYTVYRTHYTTPIFMSGERPYDQSGGAFEYRDDGMPLVQGWDPMRMSVVTPLDLSAPPEAGWPVLIYLHGTGGDYRTFCNSNADLEVATWLAPLGIVGLGIDLPLHGPRGNDDTIIDLHSFNVLQPDSALHLHRQAAADLIYLLHGLAEGPTFTLPDGTELKLDPDRVLVMGHSQGGITAAVALPWIGGLSRGTVLSGAGGLLAITAVERDSDYDFPGLIRDLLAFESDEVLTQLHPVLGMVQSLVEPTDPINYAPYWFRRDGDLFGQSPTPVLITSGIRDDQTPSRTGEALAASAGAPFVGKRYSAAVPMLLLDLDSQRLPVERNVTAWDGSPVTTGFSQWQDGDHFVLFTDAAARDLVRTFVVSAAAGAPEIAASLPPVEPEDTDSE